MQRVEPAKVQVFDLPPVVVPTPDAPVVSEPSIELDTPSHVEHDATDVEVQAPNDGQVYYFGAFVASLIWIGGAFAYLAGLAGVDALLSIPNSWFGMLAAGIVVPITAFAVVALVLHQLAISQHHASSLAAAAQSLVQPEDHAARGLARLGRAIRRELDQFNGAVEQATTRITSLDAATQDRLALIERTANAAQERVDQATAKLGAEREKLAQFTQALDAVVLSANQTLTARLQDAKNAARTASESLHAEHHAIAGLITSLQTASKSVVSSALQTSQVIEQQAQRLDSASEAAAARSEQVVMRHEKQRHHIAETIERLKQENDHMARALDFQREGMNKLIIVMSDETKKIGSFTAEGARRLDDTAALMAQRIVETTQLFAREADKLRTATDLTTNGLEQAMKTIRTAGDSSFDAAGRLGSVLIGLRDTATNASQQIESTVTRMGKILQELPSEAATQAKNLHLMLEQQAKAIQELSSRVSSAFDRVQAIEFTRTQHPQLAPPQAQPQMPLHHMPAPQHERHVAPPRPAQHVNPQHVNAQHVNTQHGARPSHPAPAVRRDVAPPQHQRPQAHDMHDEEFVPDFVVPPPSQVLPPQQPRGAQPPTQQERFAPAPENQDGRGWFNMAKRLVRPVGDAPEPVHDDRNTWDMKSLLAAAETRDADRRHLPSQPVPRKPQRPEPRADAQPFEKPAARPRGPQDPRTAAGTPSHHMIETLQAMAIDLDRFFEDDLPVELLRRYRSGERNVFARRLLSFLGPENTRHIHGKFNGDREFRDTVEKYLLQFETLMEQASRTDGGNALLETYLTSQPGKVYMALATAIGRIS